MNALLIAQMLFLLFVANGAPVVAKRLLGPALNRPIDGGVLFPDGRPLLGPAKTWRGVAAAVVATSLCAALLGLPVAVGLAIGLGAMAGDLLSSFLKRRLGWPVSSRAFGLDQLPEALVPLLAASLTTPLGPLEIAAAAAGFLLASQAVSRLMFDLRVREQPF
jgi:CDP-2,3-bis-(O-geranylgeranyl)-sn-glycerol synthase